jgi:hypothetical protein
MGETEKESQTNPDRTRGEVDSSDARRAYAAPEVTVLDFRSLIKGNGSVTGDSLHTKRS